MANFYDSKNKKIVNIAAAEIITRFGAMASGATIAIKYPNNPWDEMSQILGGERDLSRNDPLGLIFTKPNDNTLLVGRSWVDNGDNGTHDEDITEFKQGVSGNFTFNRLKASEVRRKYPSWHPYHHENKDIFK